MGEPKFFKIGPVSSKEGDRELLFTTKRSGRSDYTLNGNPGCIQQAQAMLVKIKLKIKNCIINSVSGLATCSPDV